MSYTILKHLTEANGIGDLTPENLAATLDKYCKPWMKEMGQGNRPMMYRCSKGLPITGPVGFLNVRRDRNPRDSTVDLQKAFNELLAKTGSPANRSNSLFVTGALSNGWCTATTYGRNCYVVIPVGEYDYLWSTKLFDLYSTIVDMRSSNPFWKVLSHYGVYGAYDSWATSLENMGRQLPMVTGFSEVFHNHIDDKFTCNRKIDGFLTDTLQIDRFPKAQQQLFRWVGSLMVKMPQLFQHNESKVEFALLYELSKKDAVVHDLMQPLYDTIVSSYKTDGLREALKATHEVLLHCPTVLLISVAEIHANPELVAVLSGAASVQAKAQDEPSAPDQS